MRTLLFDFDGTIADTFNVLLTIGNELLVEIGMKPITKTEVEQLRSMTIKQAVHELRIPVTKIPYLIARGRKELYKRREEVEPITGILKAIKDAREESIMIGMLTSNSRANVEHFLKKNAADDLFDFVYTGTSLFGKARIIRTILRKYKLDRSETIYIGDEIRDIIAAKRAKVKVASVTWGFNASRSLQLYNPDAIIEKPEQLKRLIRM